LSVVSTDGYSGRLELTWTNKDKRLLAYEDGSYAWVSPADYRVAEVRLLDDAGTVGETNGPRNRARDNLLIRGDALNALASLTGLPEFAGELVGKVTLAYLDPPFNTQQSFLQYDDALEHSVWLTMMRDRIRLIKELLAADGSIWVHLDHVESHRCRAVLDEEFGSNNFVADVAWEKAVTPRNNTGTMTVSQDTILVYRKSDAWALNRLPRRALSDSRHKSPDGDPIPWRDNPTDAPGASSHQGMVYAIQHPITGDLMYTKVGRCWGREQSWFLEQMSEYAPYELRQIDDAERRAKICGTTPDKVREGVQAIMLAVPLAEAAVAAQARYDAGSWPTIYLTRKARGGIQFKAHQTDIGRVPATLWPASEVGANIEGKAEIQDMFPGVTPFETPKPERLLERVIEIASHPGDIVLDCFAGSGTTAAVAHKMGRRWVTIERERNTIDTFTAPRLGKVVDGSDQGGISRLHERVADVGLPDGVSPEDAAQFTSLLGKFKDVLLKEPDDTEIDERTDHEREWHEQVEAVTRQLRGASKTRKVSKQRWDGGGGFRILDVASSMFEDDDGTVVVAEWASNGKLAEATAAQLGFIYEEGSPFVGRKGKSRLAVVDGLVNPDVARLLVDALGEDERLTLCGTAVAPATSAALREMRRGSVVRKIPASILAEYRRPRWQATARQRSTESAL
jgi:adenine-specific DNA-methyltransferase